jgi:uncharacterized protein YukE
MATKVIADADQLRAFVSRLSKVEGELASAQKALQSAFAMVSETWKDPQRDKFAEEVQALDKSLKQFQAKAQQQQQYCKTLAAKISEIS